MSIRLRLAVVFTIAAAVLFSLGSWLFVAQLSASLLRTIDAQLAAQLSGAGRYLHARGSPPLAGGVPPGEFVVQVIDPAGQVRAASAEAEGGPMLARPQLRQARVHQIIITTAAEDEHERLSAAPLRGHPGWVAVAGVSLETYDGTRSAASRDLLAAGVIFVAAAGLGAYVLARAALSPVERLRREVAAVSDRSDGPGVRVPRTRDEIAALAATMNDLLSRLRRALARQRAIVADASHELRTPLAVLRGELELAGKPGRSRDDLAGAVSRASDEVTRLARLTEQLLFLARADEDRAGLHRERTSIRPLLIRSAEQATARSRAAGVSCEVDAPAGLTAEVDPDQIREAVDNLVDNALRFAPPGTPIQIHGRAAGTDLIIEVSDSGPGFPADFLPSAFERFARPDSGRARTEGGSGLGLAIVAAIAQAHGGRATARNRQGGGASVALTVPGALRNPGLQWPDLPRSPDEQPLGPASTGPPGTRSAGPAQGG